MKLVNLSPKHLFRCKKSRSASRSDRPSSFSSGTSSSSSSSDRSSTNLKAPATPTSVLPSHSPFHQSKSAGISGDWPDFSTDTHSEVVQAFKLIDRDGDGKITTRELEALLCRLGGEPPSEEEILTMLTEVDRDGDGCISLEEFEAISPAFEPACGSELRDTFNFFDSDGDGRISAQELLGVFSTIGDDRCTLEDCQRMIGGVDSDGDGFVCFEDFSRMMERQR